MILIDSSAWIEFLRDTKSSTCVAVESQLGDEIASCEPVLMEVLAGARDALQLKQLRRMMAATSLIATEPTDYEQAAAIFRTCRRNGETPRSVFDCLIAAIAVRCKLTLLHADRDFDSIARHTALSLA